MKAILITILCVMFFIIVSLMNYSVSKKDENASIKERIKSIYWGGSNKYFTINLVIFYKEGSWQLSQLLFFFILRTHLNHL